MFTGIIEEIGNIKTVTRNKICINADKVLKGTQIGDSIAVNGVCLTVKNIDSESFEADVSDETYKVTAFNSLRVGTQVNLERAMPVNGRFGGHIVYGHVDGKAKIISIKQNGDFYELLLELDEAQSYYVIKKGSIAANGISLTVADIEDNIISLAIIPHTFNSTALKALHYGDFVNIETDIISKYIEKFLLTRDNKKEINMEFLTENGF